MEEHQLTKYVPAYGDRIAVIDYAKRKSNKKRVGLVEKLRKRIMNKRHNKDDSDDNEENEKYTSNVITLKKNGKPTRLILVGWIHKNPQTNIYKQVRAAQGGGTRRLPVQKSAQISDVLDMALETFFPNGMSRKGPKTDFAFEMWDFQRENINIKECTLSIEDMFQLTKVSTLRLYLATNLKGNQSLEETVSMHVSDSSHLATVQPAEVEFTDIQAEVVTDEIQTTSFLESVELSCDVFNTLMYPEQTTSITELITIENSEENEAVTQTTCGDIEQKPEPWKIRLHRGQCFNELIQIYSTSPIDENKVIFVDMLLPNGEKESGVDTGGVFRDGITEFWGDFYDKCTVGTYFKVPIIRHDFDAAKWTAIGNILLKGWKQEKLFPIKLAPVFMKQCLYKGDESTIIEDFLNYLSASERDTIKDCLIDMDTVDHEELMNILDTLQCKWIPNKTNIHQLISDIAHSELIQKPMFIINCWKPILNNLMPYKQLEKVYSEQVATAKNILKHLNFDRNLHPEEIKTIGYLKKFVREAEVKILSNLLRFCTGADIIVGEINIQFNATTGIDKRPIGHTCGSTLELPTTYDNFPDFRYDLNSVLESNIWVMDFA